MATFGLGYSKRGAFSSIDICESNAAPLFPPTETLSMFLAQAMCASQGRRWADAAQINARHVETDALLLGDAYYATYFLMCELQRRICRWRSRTIWCSTAQQLTRGFLH